jgi:hypothetical protein
MTDAHIAAGPPSTRARAGAVHVRPGCGESECDGHIRTPVSGTVASGASRGARTYDTGWTLGCSFRRGGCSSKKLRAEEISAPPTSPASTDSRMLCNHVFACVQLTVHTYNDLGDRSHEVVVERIRDDFDSNTRESEEHDGDCFIR